VALAFNNVAISRSNESFSPPSGITWWSSLEEIEQLLSISFTLSSETEDGGKLYTTSDTDSARAMLNDAIKLNVHSGIARIVVRVSEKGFLEFFRICVNSCSQRVFSEIYEILETKYGVCNEDHSIPTLEGTIARTCLCWRATDGSSVWISSCWRGPDNSKETVEIEYSKPKGDFDPERVSPDRTKKAEGSDL